MRALFKTLKLYHLQFLLGAFACACITILAVFIHKHKPLVSVDEKYQGVVQSNILAESKILAQEGKETAQLFQEGNVISLVELKRRHTYPCVIFRNEKNIFWSDFRFIPDYNQIAGKYEIQFFELKNGMFLVHREHFKTAENNDIEIYTYLPIFTKYNIENSYLQSAYNPKIVPSPKITLSAKPSKRNIFSAQGDFLFSLSYNPNKEASSSEWFLVALISALGAVVCLYVFLWKWHLYFLSKRVYEISWILLAVFFVGVRFLMLENQIPYGFFEWELFNPKLYASSFWSPSLGDLALNLIILFGLLFHLQRHYPRTWIFQKLIALKKISWLIITMLIFLSYTVYYEIFWIFSSIFTDSQLVLDISRNINFSAAHWLAYIIFVLLSVIYFFTNQIIGRILIRLAENKYLIFMTAFSVGTLMHMVVLYADKGFHPLLSFLNGLYILLLYYFAFPKFLYRFKYFSTLYLFLVGLFCAISGAYAMIYFGGRTQEVQMKKYAENLLEERDFSTEYSLDNICDDIRLDAGIKEYLKNPLLEKSLIRKKIQKMYLRNDFQDYQVGIYTFDAFGYPLQPQLNAQSYQEWVALYQKPEFRTDKADRFFINETQAIEQKVDINLLRMYLEFVEIRRDTSTLGYVILELKKKKNEPFKVYPELLRNERFKEPKEFKNFSYAIFKDENLVYAYGDFNYGKNFKKSLFKIKSLYKDGYEHQDFKHLSVKGERGRSIVVSVPVYAFKNVFANFSLLFLVLILVFTQVLLFYGLINYAKRIRVTFATRIQLFLNAAFFLPLAVVSLTTLSIISSSYDKDLNNSFVQKAQNAARSLVNFVQQYKKELIEKEELLKDVEAVAGYAQADINLFDVSGKLIVSSQSAIYDNELLSKMINPEVLWKVVEQKEQNMMLAESVGNLGYKSVYLAIRSYEDNQLLAILSIPFFDSEDERQRKIADVLTTIINIFTIVFMIFVIISYFASTILTEPLTLITQKIRKTTLYAYNEPLQWDSDDEIGLMVNEYNKMLIKLEQSKEALAQNEKEAAWREMAKQVAHEIKNPLTPMKLTLQHLQMRIERENPELQKLTSKPFETLLAQIDLLSDIATSFSNFAKMTIPKNEIFDISEVLRQTLQLYESDERVHLIRMLEKGKFNVQGDKQLMTQIFTNIMINAIQAVPSNREAEICVSLYKEGGLVHIEIRDNGLGIPLEVQNKVFLPNFSTKFTGSGIGLALAKRGIEHVGGKIWFETKETEGTCFFIELPLV
jgi:signal transduction histidine kinase